MSKSLILLFTLVAVSSGEKIEGIKEPPVTAAESVSIGANWNGPYNNGYPGFNGIPPSTSYGTPLAPPIGPNGVPVPTGPVAPGPIPTGPILTGPSTYYRGGYNEYTRNGPSFARFNGPNYNGWRGSNYQAGYVSPTAYSSFGGYNPAYNTQGFPYSNNYNGVGYTIPRYNNVGYSGIGIPSARYNGGYINNGYTTTGYNTLPTNGGYNY